MDSNKRLETRRANQAAFELKVKGEYEELVNQRKYTTQYIINKLADKWCRSKSGIQAIVWGQNEYRRRKRAEKKASAKD